MDKNDVKKLFLDAAKHIKQKPKYEKLDKFTIMDYDICDNFVIVSVSSNKKVFQGVAKRNPNCDEFNVVHGLNLALNRAILRLVDPKDEGATLIQIKVPK